MSERIRISDRLIVGKIPPGEEELKTLAADGFASVVNLRREGERYERLPPKEEEAHTRRLGLSYLHFPVSPDQLDAETIARFRAQLAKLPVPIFVHCGSGKRAEALARATERT